ncbi:hypothetical protein H310_01247 [Aphanomyces invadans]|uniref:Tubby C-terminal domain-containing protein n=1 Tax=Aphanomyces invadans TaxID=157072 RepID=A0A024USS3_9STRA|nr:hypothetical protein H310_01247 [Aphanomyces invadans]ETW08723.1 hypothetical protein H310_01247 [Aphanomyces invadans]|eukprot:XP_008862528.1 hypothetical protein H310_01247 [Aphanomyces invadans]
MAQRAAPLSSSRHSNQKGFFKEDERKMTSASSQAKSQKPAWQASALTATDQGENQVIPFSFDEEDDERDKAGAKDGHPSDSEHDEGSGSDSESQDDTNHVSVACSEWLHAASKDGSRDESDSSDAKLKDQPNNTSNCDALSQLRDPPKTKAQLALLDTKSLESATSSNQSADVEFSPLRTLPGSILAEGSIVRCNNGTNKFAPQYQFFLKNKLVLLAQKQLHNRTSNYHIFDMSRGGYAGQKLTKKSGNYVGKLRSNFGKHENVMVSAQAERSELGAIHFDTKVSSTKPRKLTVVCPPLSSQNEVLAQGAKPESFSTLLDLHKADKRGTDHLTVLENKEPEYEKGCYRLNFNGRVSIPSVKNFQLIARGNAAKGIVLQFGKVSDKLFHLDFKHPLTPFQAFAIALSQFNY